MRLTTIRLLSNVKSEHVKPWLLGYFTGATVMATEIHMLDKKRNMRLRLYNEFLGHVMGDCWVYLPPEVKDKFIADAKFYNIAVEESS